MSQITVLMVGDVVGQAGSRCVYYQLKELKEKYKADFVCLNGENAADGFGLVPDLVDLFFKSGVDVITSGNHIWQKKEILSYLDEKEYLLRPLNYPRGTEGKGVCIFPLKEDKKVAVINLQGVQHMVPIDNPFFSVDKVLNHLLKKEKISLILLDFHGESPQEKEAMGFYVDGRVSLMVGTHTHIQTADEKILPKGTGYITDIGMTGVLDSVIGGDAQTSLKRAVTQLPLKRLVAEGEGALCGVVATLECDSGRCLSIDRFVYS